MAAIAPPPQPTPASVEQTCPWWEHIVSGSYGHEAFRLAEITKEVYYHSIERAEALDVVSDDGDMFMYSSVPPNRVFYVKTRYIFAGKGEPLPFELDDE